MGVVPGGTHEMWEGMTVLVDGAVYEQELLSPPE
jgi:hypothetical protein